jgi:hypothetical protein
LRGRTKIALAALVAAMAAGGAWLWKGRAARDERRPTLSAVPAGVLLVGVVDLDALRASPLGAPLFKQGREIQGLGKVRDVCGFDPIDQLREIALAVPASNVGGDGGDFGLIGAGDVDADALVACASKVIAARGGQPQTGAIGSFRTVRDGSSAGGAGEIAVRGGSFVLLGGGPYLRAMVDAAEGHTATVRSSEGHALLWSRLGEAHALVTAVLTPDQRAALAAELARAGEKPAGASILAGGLAVELGPEVKLRGTLACQEPEACARLAVSLQEARDARAQDYATRLVGFGALLERVLIEARGAEVAASVTVPADEAAQLFGRVLTLRGFEHPMPGEDGRRPRAPEAPAAPDAPEAPVVPDAGP